MAPTDAEDRSATDTIPALVARCVARLATRPLPVADPSPLRRSTGEAVETASIDWSEPSGKPSGGLVDARPSWGEVLEGASMGGNRIRPGLVVIGPLKRSGPCFGLRQPILDCLVQQPRETPDAGSWRRSAQEDSVRRVEVGLGRAARRDEELCDDDLRQEPDDRQRTEGFHPGEPPYANRYRNRGLRPGHGLP